MSEQRVLPEGRPGGERRVWQRQTSRAEARCRRADDPEAPPVLARVLNISRGGVRLLMPGPFESGELLSVELPTADPATRQTLLACVVHAELRPDGEWALGCTFCRELGDDELEPFGARRARAAADDQRKWVRYPCEALVVCQPITEPDADPWPAKVVNISPSGIGLRVSRRTEVGVLLEIELPRADGRPPLKILACVVCVSPDDEGDSLLGCNFIRVLTTREFQALP